MELSRIIDDNQFGHAIALPAVLDPRKLALDIGLRENRVFEAPHHRQTTGRLEPGIEAHRTPRILVKRRRDRRPAERQHAVVVYDDDVTGRVIHRYPLKSPGRVGASAGHSEFHLGPALAVARQHEFVRRLALNLAVNCAATGNRKPLSFGTELVGIAQPTDDFQMYFRHPLALSRHVQLLNDLIADRLHFWGQPRTWLSPLGVPQDDRPNVATRGQPFPIVPAYRPPTRRPVVLNAVRDRSGEGFNRRTRDRDRLLPVNLL